MLEPSQNYICQNFIGSNSVFFLYKIVLGSNLIKDTKGFNRTLMAKRIGLL